VHVVSKRRYDVTLLNGVSALRICEGNLEWPRGFQEVTVPRFNDNGTGWW